MVSKVVKLEDILQQNAETSETTKNTSQDSSFERKKRTSSKSIENVPRGKPKSGKVWKNPKTRFSSVIKTRGIKSSFQKKQLLREDLKRVKEASRAILAAKEEEKKLKKERRLENLRRREENRKKSEIVQVIKNSSKTLKKMKKKQLRYIEKRDIDKP